VNIQLTKLEIPIADERINGTLLAPATALPAILFIHGWGGSQEQDLARAREASGLGCVCMTVDLRGHDLAMPKSKTVSREQNLQDILTAYDWLAAQPNVEPSAIAVVGISYGGYLATILSSLRSIRWLALRAPALYKDGGWELPKLQLHADTDLRAYRMSRIPAAENLALKAASAFRGDVLIVESEHDDVVPHPVIENYVAAFSNTKSLTARVIGGADHGLTEKHMRKSYTELLIKWLTEMIGGAREHEAKTKIDASRIDAEETA
jgi:dienelactone hydrolase